MCMPIFLHQDRISMYLFLSEPAAPVYFCFYYYAGILTLCLFGLHEIEESKYFQPLGKTRCLQLISKTQFSMLSTSMTHTGFRTQRELVFAQINPYLCLYSKTWSSGMSTLNLR